MVENCSFYARELLDECEIKEENEEHGKKRKESIPELIPEDEIKREKSKKNVQDHLFY